MASVNKVINEIKPSTLLRMYVDEKQSIPVISDATGVARSTIRFRLKRLSALRDRGDAVRAAASEGRLGSGTRGKQRTFTDAWRANISASALARADKFASGVSKKPSGYIEYTRGPHKGRSVHVVQMEELIGRRLLPSEVVHHDDEDKANNANGNLELMTRSAHASLHATENHPSRKRASNGQFE